MNEFTALTTVRKAFPHHSQRGLARSIRHCSDELSTETIDRETVFRASGYGQTPEATIYGRIRRIDAKLQQQREQAEQAEQTEQAEQAGFEVGGLGVLKSPPLHYDNGHSRLMVGTVVRIIARAHPSFAREPAYIVEGVSGPGRLHHRFTASESNLAPLPSDQSVSVGDRLSSV